MANCHTSTKATKLRVRTGAVFFNVEIGEQRAFRIGQTNCGWLTFAHLRMVSL